MLAAATRLEWGGLSVLEQIICHIACLARFFGFPVGRKPGGGACLVMLKIYKASRLQDRGPGEDLNTAAK